MIGSIIGGVLGVGSSIVGGSAVDKAADDQIRMANETKEELGGLYNPFIEFGSNAMGQIDQFNKPFDREAALAEYYQSPEFSMMSEQARNQQLASSEATGGLGGASTQNALASIAPQLGSGYVNQQYAQQQDLYNKLMQQVGLGFNASTNYGKGITDQNDLIGASMAGERLAKGEAIQSGIGSFGGMLGGIF